VQLTDLETSMKDTTALQIDLELAKVQFLTEVARKYSLPDVGKAIRCLINYARDNPNRSDEIFGEVRCVDC
jgi:hypothetical protein